VSPFQCYRSYNLKIVALGNRITVFVDNIKCIEWVDDTPGRLKSGKVGFRVVSGLAEFYDLRVYGL